jgi:hypothetical protein
MPVINPIVFTVSGQSLRENVRVMSILWEGALEEGQIATIGHNRGGILWTWRVPTQPAGGPSSFHYAVHSLLAGAAAIPAQDGVNCERLDGGRILIYWQES